MKKSHSEIEGEELLREGGSCQASTKIFHVHPLSLTACSLSVLQTHGPKISVHPEFCFGFLDSGSCLKTVGKIDLAFFCLFLLSSPHPLLSFFPFLCFEMNLKLTSRVKTHYDHTSCLSEEYGGLHSCLQAWQLTE